MTTPPPPPADEPRPHTEGANPPGSLHRHADPTPWATPQPGGASQSAVGANWVAPNSGEGGEVWRAQANIYGAGDNPGGGGPSGGGATYAGAYQANPAPTNGYLPGLDPRSGQYTYTQPGIIPLRPLSFGDLLSGTFAMVRYAPMRLLLAACTIMIPTFVLGGVVFGVIMAQGAASGFDQPPSANSFSVFTGILTILLQGFAAVWLPAFFSPLVVAAAAGRTPSVRASIREFFGSFGSLLLEALVFSAVFALVQFPEFLLGDSGSIIYSIVATIILTPVTLVAAMSGIVAVLEDRPTMENIKRALELLKQNFWRALGALLVIGLVIGIVFTVLIMVATIGSLALAASADSVVMVVLALILATVALGLLSTIGTTFQGSLLTLAYVDARFRSDGLDFQWANPANAGTLPQI